MHLTVYEPLLPQLEGKLCGGLHVDGRGALELPPLQTLRPYRPEPWHLTTSPPSHTGWGELKGDHRLQGALTRVAHWPELDGLLLPHQAPGCELDCHGAPLAP